MDRRPPPRNDRSRPLGRALCLAIVSALAACGGTSDKTGQTGAASNRDEAALAGAGAGPATIAGGPEAATDAVANVGPRQDRSASSTVRVAAAARPDAIYGPGIDPATRRLIIEPDQPNPDAPVDNGDVDHLPGRWARVAPPVNPAFHTRGSFSAVMAWPEIAIHAALTPDGRVMTYGTNAAGIQGAQFNYSVWDPATGEHLVLPNTTTTDIFCNAQILIPGSGDLLLAGGDIRGRGLPDGTGGVLTNRGVNDVNRYSYQANAMSRDSPMAYARWYASLLTLPDGRILVGGGRDADNALVGHPEIYTPGQGWRTLTGIEGYEIYPRLWQAPIGLIAAVIGDGVFAVDTRGEGSAFRVASLPGPTHWGMPAVEYDVGKLMIVRSDGGVSLLDISGNAAVVTEGAAVGPRREWGSLTVLADGQVLLTGGGIQNRGGADAMRQTAIWHPASGQWTAAATASRTREYHSTALLLPDATVLVAGGGAPGPVNQLNAEIYSPPYLYKADGSLAERPQIASAPSTLTPSTSRFSFTMGSTATVSKVTLVRAGAVTHSANFDQGFVTVPHRQDGAALSIDVDRPSTVLRPGYYLLFAFDAVGVPSVAKMVRVNPR